jgi:GTP-binding protein
MTTEGLRKVAIVGRPNVGKSSLFNRFVGKRQALVHDEPGVTRDRLYGTVEWRGHVFEVIDTGGLEPGDKALIRQHIHDQVDRALLEAQVVVLLVDGQEGLSGLDQAAATLLRKRGCKALLAVNKIDNIRKADERFDFLRLGMGEGIWLSSVHGLNVDTLLDAILERLTAVEAPEEPAERPVQVAIVGRPNVGKSSLINRLIEDERVLVDSEPGTTRDPVPVPYRKGTSNLLLVDTAGIRRSAKIDSPVERISGTMARKALELADLAVLVLDGTVGVQSQDQRVAGLIQKAGKPLVVAVNKWDLCLEEPEMRARWDEALDERIRFLPWAPRVYISALQGLGVEDLARTVEETWARCKTVLSTNKLNALLRDAAYVHPAPMHQGRQLAVRYVTQLRNKIGTFIFKVNDRTLVHFSYKRHLENVLRDAADFRGVPLKLIFQDVQQSRDSG